MRIKIRNALMMMLCVTGLTVTITGCNKDSSKNQFDGTKMGDGSGVVIDETDTSGAKLKEDELDVNTIKEENTSVDEPTMDDLDVESLDVPNDVEQ